MAILGVWVISKSGGLVWQKDFSQGNEGLPFSLPKLSTNDYLVFASTFQSIHAITAQLDPLGRPCSGIQSIEWKGFNLSRFSAEPVELAEVTELLNDSSSTSASTSPPASPSAFIQPTHAAPFKINCFQSPTGLKLLLLSSPKQPQLDFILRRLYEIYADFVMKNPFHTPEMPIRSERFDVAVGKLVEQMTSVTY